MNRLILIMAIVLTWTMPVEAQRLQFGSAPAQSAQAPVAPPAPAPLPPAPNPNAPVLNPVKGALSHETHAGIPNAPANLPSLNTAPTCPAIELANKPFRLDLAFVAHQFMEDFAKKLEAEKNLVATAKVADIDPCDKIHKFRMEFYLLGHPNMSDARRLIMNVVDGFLGAINSNPRIAPHLCNFPFTPDDVDIRIEFRNQECDRFYPYLGNIVYVMAYDGRVVYNTINSYNYHIERYQVETYSEARQNLIY